MKDEEYNVANFATLLSKTLIFSLPKMDEFNFSRFLKDENEILQAKDQHSRDSPTFRVHFGEFFLTIFFLLKLKTRAIPRQPRLWLLAGFCFGCPPSFCQAIVVPKEEELYQVECEADGVFPRN